MGGQAIRVTSPQGRFRSDARRVNRRVLDRVEAVGKHLFYHFDGDRIVHVHLGRYGSYTELPSPPPPPVGQVRMRMRSDHQTIDLRGPTACRVITPEDREAITARLGPDPLAGGSKTVVRDLFQSRDKPVAALLLDQTLIAGVGNIFRAEVLFEIGMNPLTPGRQLTDEAFERLWRSNLAMMRKGLKYGKILGVTAKEAGRPLAQVEGKDRFRIYGKSHCPSCNGTVETPDIAARRLYYCPRCQR